MADQSNYPPFSRLFIIGDKNATEDVYRSAFSECGLICSIQFIKERNGESKGIVYIQMSKTSEAVKAVNSFNAKSIGSMARPMKVLIATNKSDAATSDEDIMNQISRLFLLVPKTHDESHLQSEFEKFGNVTKVVIVRDRDTKQSKGLAYITYADPVEAAMAFEQCDPDYKPKFAQPFGRKRDRDDFDDRSSRGGDRYERGSERYERGSDRYSSRHRGSIDSPSDRYSERSVKHEPLSPRSNQGPVEFLASYPNSNQYYLKVRVPKGLTQNQLTRLFNIVPTLEFCRHMTNQYRTTDLAVIGFTSASCCSYAKEAFNGFEYPPGCPLEVDYYREDDPEVSSLNKGPPLPPMAAGGGMSGRFSQSSEPPRPPIPSSYGRDTRSPTSSRPRPVDGECKKRLFIVSQPERISSSLLSDMFSKFGEFLTFSYIPGKNFGFAQFAQEENADTAMRYMHGESIEGIKLKCLEAEDPPPEQKKSRF